MYRDALSPWRSIGSESVPLLTVDLVFRAETLAPGEALLGRAGPRAVALATAGSAPLVLERWTVALQASTADARPAAVYKRAIVHFRALYTLSRLLPAYPLCAREAGRMELRVQARTAPGVLADAKRWESTPIPTSAGSLACHVQYRPWTSMRIGSTEAADVHQAEVPPPAKDTSPLTQCMWSRAEHGSDRLRSLFQAPPPRTSLAMSPSSFSSLRTPPQGGFDTYMRRKAETTASSLGTQPLRIQRYARQPAYRQRARSFGGAADAPSTARSWSQRIAERSAARESIGSLPRDSPTSQPSGSPIASRLFAQPPQTPFALAKPPKTSSGDDLLELVQMLDIPPILHATPPDGSGRSRSLRTPPASVDVAAIDAKLDRMAASVQLPAVDGAFGHASRPTLRPIRIQGRAVGFRDE